ARRQAREVRVMIRGEADHLASPDGRAPGGEQFPGQRIRAGPRTGLVLRPPGPAQRGEAVLEHHDVIVGRRYLSRTPRPGRVERALVGGREERPALPLD